MAGHTHGALMRQLADEYDLDYELLRTNKHAVYQVQSRRCDLSFKMTVAITPSDHRAAKNARKWLRHRLGLVG